MTADDRQDREGYYHCMVVAKCFDDPNGAGREFMDAYLKGSKDDAVKMLENLGMPADKASEVASLQGEDLQLFVGKKVCEFIW